MVVLTGFVMRGRVCVCVCFDNSVGVLVTCVLVFTVFLYCFFMYSYSNFLSVLV